METDSPSGSCKNSSSWISNDNTDIILRPEDEEAERQHMKKIITALRYYNKYAYARVHKTECYLKSLPQRHQKMLSKYRNHLSIIRDCIDNNQAVINKIVRVQVLQCNEVDGNGYGDSIGTIDKAITQRDSDGRAVKMRHQDMENPENVDVEPFQILKAQSTLKLIARDWSAAGAEEREQSYKPIIDAIEEYYKPGNFELNEVKILVPGAGLGRLTYELACRGYECEGNEFSYFMLIASHFILNQCNEENQYTLYPWVHQYVNNLNMSDQVAAVHFPDVCPINNPPKGKISMAAGDFLQVYCEPYLYDCVATCFFIDCANNIVDFIETIYKILVPGGIWVNLGPLLYHYSDIDGENSIEPTYENLVLIMELVGFNILRNETGVRTKYAQNPQSMLKSEYESLFWVCRKPLDADIDNSAEGCAEGRANSNDESKRSEQQAVGMTTSEYRNGFDKYRH